MGKHHLRHKFSSRLVLVALAWAAALLFAWPASAVATDFTWNGEASLGSPNWSIGANWEGGVAPQGAVGNLVFPQLPAPECSEGPALRTCYQNANDLTGLTADSITIGGGADYLLEGNAAGLGAGGLAAEEGSYASIRLPLSLTAPQTWSLGPGGQVHVDDGGSVSGPSSGLTLDLTEGDFGVDGSGDVEVGAINATGGVVSVGDGGELNATDGHQIALNHSWLAAYGEGAATGPLSLSDTHIQLGQQSEPTTLYAAGSISLGSGSTMGFMSVERAGSVAGVDYPQLRASGPIHLGGASLELFGEVPGVEGGCPTLNPGDVLTLVYSEASLSGTFQGLPDGAITHLTCLGSRITEAPSVRINYTSHSATATVLSAGGAIGTLPVSPTGNGSGSATACTNGPGSPPRDVVILITGLTSELKHLDRYDPTKFSYCGLGNGQGHQWHKASWETSDRDLAHMAYNTFDHNPDGNIAPVDLTDSLAKTGAVLLPFSYDGVALSGTSANPRFEVAPFTSDTPGAVSPQAEAEGYLFGLIRQIHRIWKSAHIQVIGHSEGGFVAEQLFEHKSASVLRGEGVTRIFSLDSPINGVASATNTWLGEICRGLVEAHLGSRASCLGVLSPSLLDLYARRWEEKEPIDRMLIRRDLAANQIYIPIGTANDWLYTIADISTSFGGFATGVCGGLDTQILWPDFSFSCYLEDIQNQGGRWPSNLSSVTPDPSSGTPQRPGFALKSHEFVMQSANNIRFITQYGPEQYSRYSAKSSAALSGSRVTRPDLDRASGTQKRPLSEGLPSLPFAYLAEPAVSAGGELEIVGTELGEATGQVSFRAKRGRATGVVISWSPTRIDVSVPTEAVSGLVVVDTAEDEELVPGQVAVLGPANGVERLVVVGRSRAVSGDAMRLRVRATDAAARPVSGVSVGLFGGGTTEHARTDRRGVAIFRLDGYGSRQFVATSGTARALVTARWAPPPKWRLSLTARRIRARKRPAWTLMARLTTAQRRPVARQSVAFKLHGLPGSTLSIGRVLTNRKGVAVVTCRPGRHGAVLVEAIAEHGALTRGVTIR